MTDFPILSLSIFTPLICALIILILCKDIKKAKICSLIFSIVTLILSLYIFKSFSPNVSGYQFEDVYEWFSSDKIIYYVGVDSISLPFILLTNLLMLVVIIGGWKFSELQSKNYLVLLMVLHTLILGAFSAVDVMLFYVFFESVLIPMFFMIGIWGGDNRIYAAYKFFLYTLVGSLLLLLSVLLAYREVGSASISELVTSLGLASDSIKKIIWFGFFASFAIKIPMWPFHTWLPDAHVEAPTSSSMILAGILLKMGGYGFLRLALPILPEISYYVSGAIIILSVFAIIYASLVAFAQKNMKKVIAYSSVAHMGYVTMAIFSGNTYGVQGAIFQMFSHGLISAGLFLAVGILSEQSHTKNIKDYGGVAKLMPNFSIFFMMLTLASIALPGTSGFIGEILSLIAVFKTGSFFAPISLIGVVLGAVYMLVLYRNIMFGDVTKLSLRDVNCHEFISLFILVFLVLILGVYPSLLIDFIKQDAQSFAKFFSFYK